VKSLSWLSLLLLALCSVFLLATPSPTTEKSDDFISQLAIRHQRNIEHKERVSLINFFDHHHGKKPYPITAYLTYADQFKIDYRLLPAISVAESSAGNYSCGNNWWGWQSCRGDNFGSVAEGIQFVSRQLGAGVYYRGKTINQILRAYNPNPAYAVEVEKLIKEISNE
jgi:hypothetical protein